MSGVIVRLDRVQLVSWAPQGRRPPQLDGYKVVRDWLLHRQTNTSTYARRRWFKSLTSDAEIYWDYQRQKGWLKPWKITLVADDMKGLSYGEIQLVLKHCRYYRFLIIELAVDFDLSLGISQQFVRQYGVFGKSRRRANR